jgi:acetylornithine deacetylase/succinyl-diaminopimelate desuccinylase-like protein
MEMIERARELAAQMRPAMIDFAQKGIRCPSLPGEERAFAQLVLKELQTLGYEATCVDDWGNVMGMVRGNAAGPTIMWRHACASNQNLPIGPRSATNLHSGSWT